MRSPGSRLVADHRLRTDAGDVGLAVGILDVGEEHVPRHLAVNAHRLNLLQNAVAGAFQHLSPPRPYPPSGGPLSPTQDPLERKEERLAPPRAARTAASDTRRESGRTAPRGRWRAYSVSSVPFIHSIDVVAAGQDMRIDDQADVRISEAALIEQPRIGVRREDRLGPPPAAEGGAKRLVGRKFLGDQVRRVVVLRRHLEGELTAGVERGGRAPESASSWSSTQWSAAFEKIRSTSGLLRQPVSIAALRGRRTPRWCRSSKRRPVGSRRFAASPPACSPIDRCRWSRAPAGARAARASACRFRTRDRRPACRRRPDHGQQVVERLLALALELVVLARVPGVSRHRSSNGSRSGSSAGGACSPQKLCTLTPSSRTGRRPASVLSSRRDGARGRGRPRRASAARCGCA